MSAEISAFIMKAFYISSKNLFEGLSEIQYSVIKGEPLSMQAYGSFGKRVSSDVDILIPRNMLPTVERELKRCSFINTSKLRFDKALMLSSSHQTSPWIKELSPLGFATLDLNFDLLWGEYEGKRVDIENFLSDTIEMEIYGVKIKTLPPLKAMVHLILHHYKDMNSIFLLVTRKSIKYDMYKDIYHLLKNNLDNITIDKLYVISTEYGIVPYVFYVLYYTGQVFDDKILKQYIEAFRTPEGEALLNCYGLCAKEQKEWKYDFKTRLESDNLYDLIKDDLTEKDKEKIAINKRVFMGYPNEESDKT